MPMDEGTKKCLGQDGNKPICKDPDPNTDYANGRGYQKMSWARW